MQKKSILIVEDDPIIGADLQDRLIDLGYEVMAIVESGEEALLKVRRHVPDLILLDIQLAGSLDGVDTALRLRKTTKNVPLIFLTSNSDSATFRRARQAQPQAFISKPFRGRDLIHAVELAIGSIPRNQPAGLQSGLPQREDVHQDRLFIKVKERLVRLMFSDILFLEADDYYCKVYTKDREYLATKTLKKINAQLPADGPFFRCHRSYIVNLNQITEIGELYVFLGRRKVPLSRSKRGEILTLVNKM